MLVFLHQSILAEDGFRFVSLMASDLIMSRRFFFKEAKMEIHNNKTKFNGNWFFWLLLAAFVYQSAMRSRGE